MSRKTIITEEQALTIMNKYRLGIDSRITAKSIGCSQHFISNFVKAFNGSKKKLDLLAQDHADLIIRISPFYNQKSSKAPQYAYAKENGNVSINAIFDPEKMQLQSGGLTKREYFAGLAMQGLLSANAMYNGKTDERALLCQDAIAHADELLKQLEKTK